MSYRNVKGEQIDLTELTEPIEILVINSEMIEVEGHECKKFFGLLKNKDCVEFIASTQLVEILKKDHLYMITFIGHKDLKGGKKLNLFKVDVWEGDLPKEWK